MSYSLAYYQGIGVVILTAVKVERGIYDYVPSRQISEMLAIPLPTTVKILQTLNRAGILETKEGSKGGVRLAKHPDEITLLDVFTAIEADRPLFRMEYPSDLTGPIAQEAGRNVTLALHRSEQAMRDSLAAVTISSLYPREPQTEPDQD
ncbi:BadM/Rrf2 family transcriptional regulator [Paenibacillus mucilaginosus 3016]|uniref:BadM/Rrf2 family transcriptional regulator n=1 Tax=Paenibacillus mucilaginosus 3016 TaxID=1116391 RepID=H6NGQ8_9BACL|nr:Rrf2 family transcriptional regulator [Paenibacillus mucilaginosus]AFC33961.1 BadM/Rrf2 family transcriptional regulator [Paenibacillus mucilaginosus 3016]